MFIMLRIEIKVFGKLLVLFPLHLFWISKWPPSRFQNGCHFQHILAYISFLSYLESSKRWLYPRGYIYVYNAKDCNKRIWKVTSPFPFASILNFKMAIFMMCMMPKIAIKSHRKLLVDFPLAAILDLLPL